MKLIHVVSDLTGRCRFCGMTYDEIFKTKVDTYIHDSSINQEIPFGYSSCMDACVTLEEQRSMNKKEPDVIKEIYG
jgi:hypothetical protein